MKAKVSIATRRIIAGLAITTLAPAATWAETDRVVVLDQNGNAQFRVTDLGNVTGASFTGAPTDGAAISIQQGATEPASAAKFSVFDNAGVSKVSIAPAGITVGAPALSAPVAVDSALNPGIAGSPSIVISGDGNKERFELRSSVQPAFVGRVSGGTMAAPEATPSGKTLFSLAGGGHDGVQWITANNPALIAMQAEENFTPTANGTRIIFGTTPTGSPALARTERMRITSFGNVGIGTTAPGEKLEVNGNVKAAAFIGDGSQLINIPAGPQGAIGPQGPQGPVGPVGPQGPEGPAGSSDTQNQILSKIGSQTNGAVLVMQQGSAEPANTVKLAITDTIGAEKVALSPAGITVGAPALAAPVAIDSTVNTGIAGSPTLVISGDTNKERFELRSSVQPAFVGRTCGGTVSEPSATPNGKTLFSLAGGGHDGTDWLTTANPVLIAMQAEEEFSPTANGTRITFATTPSGFPATSRAERMRITSVGNIGIGTTAPTQRLEVNGGIRINTTATHPACDEGTRGTFWFVNGGAGDDSVEVCAKLGGNYLWKAIW